MLHFPFKLDSVLSQLRKRYQDDLNDFREYVKIDFSSELLSDDFHQTFFKLLFADSMNQYSPLKYYWLKMIEDFFYILELHYDEEDHGLSDDDQDFSPEEREEEIVGAWEQTSFASALESMLDEGLDTLDASMTLIPLMESQILSFAYLHFSPEEFECETAFLYNMAPEFGDYETRLNLLETCQYVEFENIQELYPALPISEIDRQGQMLGLDNSGETDFFPIQNHESVISIDKAKIFVIPGCDLAVSDFNRMKKDLEECLKANQDLSNGCKYQVRYIVLSQQETAVFSHLPETLHLAPWKTSQELLERLQAGLVSLAIEHLDMAWELAGEDDLDPIFFNPFTRKKDLLVTTVRLVLEKGMLGTLSQSLKQDCAKTLSTVKNTDLLATNIRTILEAILK